MSVYAKISTAANENSSSNNNKNNQNSGESFLRLGDEIYFYDENDNMLTAENPLDTRVCVQPRNQSFLSSNDAMRSSIFRLEPQQSHSAQKELENFIGQEDVESLQCEATTEELEQLKLLQQKAAKEVAQNETENRRLLGKPIVYGQVIQLYNQHFKKYLTVSGKTGNQRNQLQVNLSNESVTFFRIMPRYRIRFVGDVIRIGETIALQCIRPEGYLNVDYTHKNKNNFEVYSHTRISSWNMKLHYSSTFDQDTKHVKYTNSGQYVRFYHKEMESYLEAPSINGEDLVVLKKHIINPLDPKESDSPRAFWEIENADLSRGSKVRWKKSIRIRHIVSRAYLSIDPSNFYLDTRTGRTIYTLKLLKNPPCPFDPTQDSTLFQLVPVSTPSMSGVPYGSFVRIQHVATECWMHAANGEEENSMTNSISFLAPTSSPISSLSPTQANNERNSPRFTSFSSEGHERYNSTETLFSNNVDSSTTHLDSPPTFFPITATKEFYYHDCFSITLVDEGLADVFNFANDMMPQLQAYLCKDRPDTGVNYAIQDEECESIKNILKALIRFCTKSSEQNPLKRVGLPIEYHQALLRDIGVIETVIHMIVVPFDVEKRAMIRTKLCHPNDISKKATDERKVTKSELLLNKHLSDVLTLCYHLLRVFLIRKSVYEDNDMSEDAREKQLYVFNKAGEAGISLFIEHLSYNIGAAEMMIPLLELVEAQNLIPNTVVNGLIDKTIKTTQSIVRELKTGIVSLEEKATPIRLLSALCQSSAHSRSSLPKVIDRLFDDGFLLQTRIGNKSQVEIKLKGDQWRDLNALLIEQPNIICFIESLLDLIYSLSFVRSAYNDVCLTKEVCLKCLKNTKLPCTFRAKVCDILRVFYVDVSSLKKVALSDFTVYKDRIDQYTDDYFSEPNEDHSEFYSSLKKWIFRFLDSRHHVFTDNTDDILFLSSIMKLIYSKLRFGFFTTARDVGILFRSLVHVLDGRTDARNEEHFKHITDIEMPRKWHERYVLTEKNQFVMITKIQILEIFDLIFDLRLRVRMSKITRVWKDVQDNVIKDYNYKTGLQCLKSIVEETALRDRENSLMPILKDILKYQYAPLKEIAIIVMHRLFTDSQELFKNVTKVVILKDEEQVQTHEKIKEQLRILQCLVSVDDENHLDHLAKMQKAIEILHNLLTVPTNEDGTLLKYDETIYCRLFKCLDACDLFVKILEYLQNISVEHYHVHVDIICACLELLCTAVKNDKELQSQFVLSNMDLLIDLTELSPKIAPIFARLCSNNLYLSVHIKEEHIIRIIQTSEGHAGEYLAALHDLLKTQGKFIKKNQDVVMRYIMDHRREYVPFDDIHALKDTSTYCINLISILAICGQGENTFGQFFARTIFSIQDIYDLVHDDEVSIHLKAVMLKFLASIYIEDVELPTHLPILENENVLQLLAISESAVSQCLDVQESNSSFCNFVFRGVLAFLRAIFEYHISIEIIAPEEIHRYSRLVDMTLKLLPLTFEDEKALQATLACLDSMINVAGFRGSMRPKQLRDTLKEATVILDRLYLRNHHTPQQTEAKPIQDDVNQSFQFMMAEIKSSEAIHQYQDEEFKKLYSHFALSDVDGDRDGSIESLIAYLSTMTTDKVSRRVELYQMATIKLLEEAPRQYIRQRLLIDPNNEPGLFEELEEKKTRAQNILNDLGCTLVAQNLLSSPRRRIFDASLKLLISLLEGGNKNVQDKLEEYFYSIREERFFYSFHQRLQSGINASKDAQIYLARRMYKVNRQQHMLDYIMQQQPEKPRSHKKSKSISFLKDTVPLTLASKRNSHHLMKRKRASSILASSQQQSLTKEDNEMYKEVSELMVTNSESTTEFGSTTKDFKVMQDTMRTLQLMVEGHNLNLQMYLAQQPDNIKSFNIVLDIVDYFHSIVPLCNSKNIELIIQVVDTITELAQGCLQNQVTIFNNKIINPVNMILKEPYNECSYEQVKELKSKVVTCLLSLLEGGIENSETIFREMSDTLDLIAVKNNMDTIYEQNLGNLKSKNVYEKLECGFLYCILVMTLSPALNQEQSAMFFEKNDAFNYFQNHTGKIEILMDYGQEKQLTRVLFPIPEICQFLRRETKQKFLWNVDRESPSSKIEDFVQQSEMIIYEIENQAHVAHNKYLSFLTEYSAFWWESAYGVSILLNLLLMMYPDLLDVHPAFSMVIFFRYLLGAIHFTLWLLLTNEFYFIQLPVLVNRRYGPHVSKLLWATISESRFLYHMMMLLFSGIGVFYPGFYSLHLLDFVFRDSVLQGVISSITLNVHSISRTAILGIIVVYIHSIIAYMYFRKEFDGSKGLFCGSLSECFVTVLSHGVRSGGGIGDILEPDEFHKPSGWRTVFEMSFYLVVVVFLLNAIFGIIFDTFGHLRDERSSIQQDMKNSCFICSIPAVEFQRHTKKGFEDHVRNDHNIWQYLFFLVHLKYKDRTEYTGPESYVSACLKEADYSFFPINRALGLFKDEEDDSEKLEKLEEMNQFLIEKITKLEEQLDKITDHQTHSRHNSFMLSPM